MASLLDRMRYANDFDTDGGSIDINEFGAMLKLWNAGTLTAAQFKSHFSMTTPQGDQLDDILATRPATPILFLGIPAYVAWVHKVCGVMHMAALYTSEFDTDAKVQTALGI